MKRKVLWRRWPQWLAPNVELPLERRRGSPGRTPRAAIETLQYCASKLAEREKVAIDEIVVFFPYIQGRAVNRGIRRIRAREGGVDKLKGLTVCAVHELRKSCIAFKLSDVRAHHTPADPYYTVVETRGKARKIRPEPLYGKKESNLGKVIHE